MSRSGRMRSAMAVVVALALSTTLATAQQPPLPGLAADGSITADGVTFSADDLQAIVDAYSVDRLSLPADLPMPVRMAVYQLASRSPVPTPGSAGQVAP